MTIMWQSHDQSCSTLFCASALMQFPSASNDLLMLAPSLILAPLFEVTVARSDPARSMRLIFACVTWVLRLAVRGFWLTNTWEDVIKIIYNIKLSLFSVCPSACLSFSLIPLPYLEDSVWARWCGVGLSRMLGTLLVPRRKHTQQLFRWLGLNIDQSKQLGHMDKTHTRGSACYLVSGEPTDHETLVTILAYGQWSRGLEQVPNSFVVNLKTENTSLTYTAKYVSL